MNTELVNFIITQLNNYTKENSINYLLESRNSWVREEILEKCDSLKNDINKFNSIPNAFEKDVYLKFIINDIYNKNNSLNNSKLNEWIIKDWGGISTHKHLATLNNSKEKRKFDRISSWSKLLSFENIQEDIIYDSRVVYSLNWLIYKYNKLNNKREKYLFQPTGRNKKLSLLPVDSIIYFEYASNLKEELKGNKIYNNIFVGKDECYNYAKSIINKINTVLFMNIDINILSNTIQTNKYPFFTEMLLFEIADKEVFNDIKSTISVQIKT